ncbi:o-succinylbenzoate synthase [Balneicella halophila]|uniref:O-succinylbenzoate synthase n=1 Tax=Balneicella halophila TaxID=1537566 RepID=A0A7L4UQK5_BALHA|nr:o-succinylbenzoate synthase [Balneicella halophila]PVX51792.1 o-succinylbenzoate synthase [Balneicella halophila]
MLKADYKYHKLEFKQPSGTSRGVLKTKDSWFISIWDESNPSVKGIGECSLIPKLSYDDNDTIEAKIKEVCENIEDYFYWLNGGLTEYPALQFAVETALLDLQKGGKHLLFPSPFTEGNYGIKINGLLWMGSYDFMEEQLHSKTNSGFKCIKMKVGAINVEKERELLKKIRQNFPEHTIRVDANGAFTPTDVMEHLDFFAELGIHSIEQPLKQGQWKEMAKLCKNTPLPIALDEELIGIFPTIEKIALLETIKPQYIILKPSLLGGFKASKEWIDLAEERNIGWWVTSALESNIGLNTIAQWTATLNTENSYQGLGTGSLYTNNINSPLEIRGEELWYNPKKEWECF